MDFFDVSFGSEEQDTSDDEFFESDDEVDSSKKFLEDLPAYLEKFKLWGRSECPGVEGQKLTKFYLLDCDAWACPTVRNINRETVEKPATSRSHMIRLSGIGEHGETVSCFVTGFLPYFYVTYPKNLSEEGLAELKDVLNQKMVCEFNRNPTLVSYSRYFDEEHPPVVEVSRANADEIFGFHSVDTNPVETVLKVSCKLTRFLSLASELLVGGSIHLTTFSNGDSKQFQSYEHKLSPSMRFLTSLNLACCSWVELLEPVYVRSGITKESLKSHAQLEFELDYKMLLPNGLTPPNTDYPASLRVLSVDIEVWCKPPYTGGCPRNGSTEVIQIGNVLKKGTRPEDVVKVMFALGSVDALPGAEIFSFDCEKQLLNAWSAFVIAVDPDVISGYNISKFDLPYMLERAEILGVSGFPYMSRFKKSPAYHREIRKESKRINKYGSPIAQIPGRVVFDMLPLMMQVFRNRGYGKYRLGAVAVDYLKETGELKDDVKYHEIDGLQRNGPSVIDGRGKLAKYCLQDAWLVLQLMNCNPCGSEVNYVTDFLKYYSLRASTSGSPLRYHTTKSEVYDKYYKSVRKCKNPDVTYPTLPSTGEKRKIHEMSFERANKVRRSLFSGPAETGPSKATPSSSATVTSATTTTASTAGKDVVLTELNAKVLLEESLSVLDYGKTPTPTQSPSSVPGTSKVLYSYEKICKQLRSGRQVDLKSCLATPEPVDPDLEYLDIDSWSDSDFVDLIPAVERKLSCNSPELLNMP